MLVSSRATNILLVLLLAVGIGIVAMLATGARGGPLDPPGPPAATLPQVGPRTPISSLPYTISSPGSYYLTRNLAMGTDTTGITISVEDVAIGLNGFTLSNDSQGGLRSRAERDRDYHVGWATCCSQRDDSWLANGP